MVNPIGLQNKFVFLLNMHADVYAHEECERDNIRNKFAKMFAGDGEQGQMRWQPLTSSVFSRALG